MQRNLSRTVPISTVLAVSFGTLIIVAVVTVLGIGLISGLTNTRNLLIDKATAAMKSTRGDITDLLNPAENQTRYLADLIYSGAIDINNRDQLSDALLAALAGTPQVNSLAFITADMTVTAGIRKSGKVIRINGEKDPVAIASIKEISENQSANWGPLVYVPQLKDTVLNFRQPVSRDGKFIGALVSTISVTTVNDKIKSSPALAKGTQFILYGQDHVLMRQNVNHKPDQLTEDGVVPKLKDIGDPVLRSIWSPERHAMELLGNQDEFHSHHISLNGDGYLFFYSSLSGYSDKDLIVGYWVRDRDAIAEVRRLAIAAVAGLAVMLIAAIIALLLGRRISRPILALSAASQQISLLEFRSVAALPKSRFREINEANEAYNAMLRGLGWFENYVPKALVRRLMESGEAESEQRIVTVMFTDIANFTRQAEDMQSGEVANFLNHHFHLVTSCIEAEGGTVDKFIGDAVMAFWGAPEVQEDHAIRACRAAKAIAASIRRDNDGARKSDRPPIHMRIGLHTGPLVVGNIGSSGRINYTVVGDTVNIAQRMEQHGKSLPDAEKEDVITLITEETYQAAKTDIEVEKLGAQQVKGRHEAVHVYRLR
ncbi:MAG: adenylate/guanylate cyclase domain-containing protein [Alphaproteobacteria bacterium]|nr:MAG: adenylate/guanylate cyclase domain-containing protein [Alphaproteobacteria bacterium]